MKLASLSKEPSFSFLQPNSYLLYFTCLIITTIFSFYLLSSYYTACFNYTPNVQPFNQTHKERESCDLFEGQWVPDQRGPIYTNYSCATIPDKRNCFFHGRKDIDFLHWRWKPHSCELRRFDPRTFISAVRGKKMAFIGDSLARNQMDSLLCLLSSIETPKRLEDPKQPKPHDPERATAIWEFPRHNFTVMALWSQFLVAGAEIVVNGTATGNFRLHLDRVDTSWSQHLPLIDYAIFSGVHWFFRQNMLYEGNNLVGCVYCNGQNVTDFGPGGAIKRAFQTAFKAINDCRNCGKIFTLLRTYSPSHFENGEWNSGGACNRTRPVGRGEVMNAGDLGFRNVQVEEIGIARKEGERSGNKFEVIDVTEMMLMRPDGHPGMYQGKAWMKGYSDCVHWCLPGPIDTWNEILLELITRNIRSWS